MQWAWGALDLPVLLLSSPPQTHWYQMIPLTQGCDLGPHHQPWTTLGPYMAVSIFVLMANRSLTSSEME